MLAQIEAIRRSGKTNMLDKATVQRIAYECDFHTLVCFIEEADGEDYMEAMQRASANFDNPHTDLPIDGEVPDEITIETTL